MNRSQAPGTATPTAPLIMKGGAKAHITDFVMKYSKFIDVSVLTVLVLAIVFVKQIPLVIRSQAGTTLGRILLFVTTLYIGQKYSWISGLLMAVLTLLLLSISPGSTRSSKKEGFAPFNDTNVKLVQEKQKWWVEKLLKENPVGIQEETVKTQAIQ